MLQLDNEIRGIYFSGSPSISTQYEEWDTGDTRIQILPEHELHR